MGFFAELGNIFRKKPKSDTGVSPQAAQAPNVSHGTEQTGPIAVNAPLRTSFSLNDVDFLPMSPMVSNTFNRGQVENDVNQYRATGEVSEAVNLQTDKKGAVVEAERIVSEAQNPSQS